MKVATIILDGLCNSEKFALRGYIKELRDSMTSIADGIFESKAVFLRIRSLAVGLRNHLSMSSGNAQIL